MGGSGVDTLFGGFDANILADGEAGDETRPDVTWGPGTVGAMITGSDESNLVMLFAWPEVFTGGANVVAAADGAIGST